MQKVKNFIFGVTLILFVLFVQVENMLAKKVVFFLLLLALLVGFVFQEVE